MNKGQLVEAVASKVGSCSAAEEAVDTVLDTMVRAVVAGDKVQVTGFGTLESVQRSARTARNPQTGEKVRVKKSTVPRFRPGQGFKDLVSGAKKMPRQGPSIMKAPKGSLTPGKSAAPAPAKRGAAKKTSATAATTVSKKTAPAKKATAKKATAKKAAAKKTTARKTATAAKTTAPARKTATAKKAAPAKRTTGRVAK